MIRRRRRNLPQRLGAFEGINITPFTDVLLVLLIIFMIAGSALAPTGLGLSGLAAKGELESPASERAGLIVEIDAGGETRLLYQDETLSWGQVEKLPNATPVTLSIEPSTPAEQVILNYDRLLNQGKSEIEWAPPRSPED